jgi:hypothetical protein
MSTRGPSLGIKPVQYWIQLDGAAEKWGSGEGNSASGPYFKSCERSSRGRSLDVVTLIQHSQIIGLQLVRKPGKAVVIDDRDSVSGKRFLTIDAYHRDCEMAIEPLLKFSPPRDSHACGTDAGQARGETPTLKRMTASPVGPAVRSELAFPAAIFKDG